MQSMNTATHTGTVADLAEGSKQANLLSDALAERDTDTAVIETLHCKSCDEDFTRTRKRGVKPSVCPPCKATAEAEKVATPSPRSAQAANVEALDRDDIILTCVEYGVTPRIAIPFMLIGETPPRADTLWSFKQAKVINGFKVDLTTDESVDDFDPLTGSHIGGQTTLGVHDLDLYSVPSL